MKKFDLENKSIINGVNCEMTTGIDFMLIVYTDKNIY